MDLISALQHRLVYANVDDFYLLSRTALVKDEKNYDKFDRAFSAYFKGLEDLHGLLESLIPDEWLRHEFEKSLTPEDLKQIESLGGLEKLIEAFKKAKEEAEKAEAKEGEEGEDGDKGNADKEGRDGPGGMVRARKRRRKKSGMSGSTRILMTPWNWVLVISRWRCVACANLRGPVWTMNWISTIPFVPQRIMAACWISRCAQSAVIPSRFYCSWISADRWMPMSKFAKNCFPRRALSSSI